MLIIYDDSGREVPAHRDHDSEDLCHEFIWLRTNFDKPFYMLDPGDAREALRLLPLRLVRHGQPVPRRRCDGGLSFSIRVDGRFSDDFRRAIPFPAAGRSAAPRAVGRGGGALSRVQQSARGRFSLLTG
jgi:hypothetical protein